MPQFRPPCEPETPEERDARRKRAFDERQANERDSQYWERKHNLSTMGIRRGRCPSCQIFVEICRLPFPVAAFTVFACLTFIPLFFIGGTSGWFAIGFAWWRLSQAVCTRCGGKGIQQKMGRDVEGQVWRTVIAATVVWIAVSWGLMFYDFAKMAESSG